MSQPTLHKVPYESYLMHDPNGVPMCRTPKKRMLWYVSRGLAYIDPNDPHKFHLTFTPKDRGHANDPFYLQLRQNHCCVCGSTQGLTRHHVVPYMYRRHFPNEVKNRSSYDVLPLCSEHHTAYESMAEQRKQELEIKYGYSRSQVPLSQGILLKQRTLNGYRRALHDHGAHMPAERRTQLEQRIAELSVQLPPEPLKVEHTPNSGAFVVSFLTDDNKLTEFIQAWRRHFVSCMQPQHMPAHWTVSRPLERSNDPVY